MAKKTKRKKYSDKSKANEYMMEVCQTRGDIKTFIEKFRSDVDRKRKEYQLCARKLQNKKKR